jgi:predicted nucleic-acid-binding Zn-ribbon protein
MSAYHRCPKCNSDQMIDGGYVAGALGPRVVVGVDFHPDRGRLAHTASTLIHASVCGSCGFVELYANRPDELYAAYQQAERANRPAPRIRA